MKQRKLVIGLLVLLAVAVSGFTFAYWSSGISTAPATTETNTINIGTGDSVTTTVAVTDETGTLLPLVPVGRQDAGVTVNSITYSFDIVWAGTSSATDTTGAQATLHVTPVLSGAAAPELSLFTVTAASTQTISYGSTTTVTVTVTFTTEPANVTQYNAIQAATLSLGVTFLVDTVVPA